MSARLPTPDDIIYERFANSKTKISVNYAEMGMFFVSFSKYHVYFIHLIWWHSILSILSPFSTLAQRDLVQLSEGFLREEKRYHTSLRIIIHRHFIQCSLWGFTFLPCPPKSRSLLPWFMLIPSKSLIQIESNLAYFECFVLEKVSFRCAFRFVSNLRPRPIEQTFSLGDYCRNKEKPIVV